MCSTYNLALGGLALAGSKDLFYGSDVKLSTKKLSSQVLKMCMPSITSRGYGRCIPPRKNSKLATDNFGLV